MDEKPASAKPAKTPYRTPTLFVYGDVKELTRATGNGFFNDGVTDTKTS